MSGETISYQSTTLDISKDMMEKDDGSFIFLFSVTYCHTGRKAVWIKDDIWSHPRLSERHVFFGPSLTTYPLLSCTTGKFVPNNWVSLSKKIETVKFCNVAAQFEQ